MRNIFSLAVLLAINPSSILARKPSNSILLSSVKSLTLRDGQKTSHRRVSAIPQLKCVGGSGKGLYNVDVMRCKNSGSEYDAEDVQWTCQASLPPEFKLGSTDVICEGYDSPDDPYVLKGSCGVEFRLILTDLGEEKYGRNGFDRMTGFSSKSSLSGVFSFLFWVAFIGIACLVVYRIFVPVPGAGQPPRRGYGRGWGGGGGGPDDGHDDPPPPYTPRSKQYRSSNSRSNAGGWQPGFWSGTAAGAAAGYMMGNRNNNRGGAYQQGYGQAGPSNWFGGGRNQPTFGSGGYGAGPSSFGSSSSSPSSSRQESTGFGGTRRR